MLALGLPDFGPVQNNISFNARRGATRGIHAEPWDKFVSVAAGRVFAAWVDLREGETFGATFTTEIDPGVAVFVPRGVGNAYQALEDDTAYTYLVNDHWRPGQTYPALNLADETAAIPWPIPLAEAEISEKDQAQPGPGRRHPDGPAEDAGRRRPRPARHAPCQVELPARRPRRPAASSTSPTRPPSRPGRGTSTPWSSTPRPTRPSTPPRPPRAGARLGGQRPGAGAAGPAGRRARLHPGALLDRLRLRRHRRGAHRGRAALAARRLRPDQGRRRPRRRHARPGTTWCAPRGWSARARTSSAPCIDWPTAASPRPWSPTRSAG